MLLEVIICAIGDTPQFFPTKRKAIVQVIGVLTVMATFAVGVATPAQIFCAYAEALDHETPHHLLPILEHSLPVRFRRVEEIFNFGLLKLQRTEDKLAGGDLVAETFTDLSN